MIILIEGWVNIPHSYAIVLCFQLIELSHYNHQIYVKEVDYFRDYWKKCNLSIFKKEYQDAISSFIRPLETVPDLIYRIAYPYNISEGENIIPKCVFYTSEFKTLDINYFSGHKEDNFSGIIKYIKNEPSLYFTSPSKWSAEGLKDITNKLDRNRIISHGVNTDIFYYDPVARNKLRRTLNIKENQILLLNLGAYKSLQNILPVFNVIIHKLKLDHYRLLIKNINDLYLTNEKVDPMKNILCPNMISFEEYDNLFKNYIIFTDKTLTFDELRGLYNACDLYISPYIAEGFNLTPLEALSCGTNVLLNEKGSTEDYINTFKTNKYKHLVHEIKTNVVTTVDNNGNKLYMLEPDLNDCVYKIVNFRKEPFDKLDYKYLKQFININLSWTKFTKELLDYFEYIIKVHNKNYIIKSKIIY